MLGKVRFCHSDNHRIRLPIHGVIYARFQQMRVAPRHTRRAINTADKLMYSTPRSEAIVVYRSLHMTHGYCLTMALGRRVLLRALRRLVIVLPRWQMSEM